MTNHDLSSDELKALQARIDLSSDTLSQIDHAIRASYFGFKSMLRDTPTDHFLFIYGDNSCFKKLLLKGVLKKQNAITCTTLELLTPLVDSLDADTKKLVHGVNHFKSTMESWYPISWYDWLKPGCLNKILIANEHDLYKSLIQRFLITNARPGVLKLQLAIRQFELQYGRLPERLELLVPDFIESVPLDPMDGLPLRWNAKTQRLYSVGWNLIDDRGVFSKPWSDQLYSGDLGMEYLWKPEEPAPPKPARRGR